MASTQELTRRIKSIKSTRKVTRAMQMVSASKMRKAQSQALASRSYARVAADLIASLDSDKIIETPLLRAYSGAPKIAVVVVSTNKGLVGSFNTNLLTELLKLERVHAGKTMELVVCGRKVSEAAARMRKLVVADFPKSEGGETIMGVLPLATRVSRMYTSGEYAAVYLLYNHFISTLTQKATVKQLLPFVASALDSGTGLSSNEVLSYSSSENGPASDSRSHGRHVEYLFEPSPEKVLNDLIPRIMESQIYQALLESDASEHSSRMIMMKNATESAGDLIADLTLTFNQLRQNKITTELSEITAGKIALEG